MTTFERKHFHRIKAAAHDLINVCGGIERAAELCGYSKSTVGRWHNRDADDLPPLVAVLALEMERGQPLVTRAMCGLHGLETAPANSSETPLIGAFVQVAAAESALASTVATAMADGVITGSEQNAIEECAAALDRKTEALRGAVAANGGKPLKIVG